MKRLTLILMILHIAIFLGACNLSQENLIPSPTAEDSEIVTSTEPSEKPMDEGNITSIPESEEPSISVEPSGSESPGETLPSIKRIQAGQTLILQQVAMIDQEVGWAVGGADGRADSILRSTDGGWNWAEVSPPEIIPEGTTLIASGSFLDASNAWVLFQPMGDVPPGVAQDLIVWRTSDAGAHWQASAPASVEFIGSEHSPALLQFNDPDQGWLLARYGGAGMHRYPVYLLHSVDGGGTWQTLEDPYEGQWLQSCPKTGWDWLSSGVGIVTIGFCPFDSAEIHLSFDEGQSWESIRLPFPPGEEAKFGSTSCEAHSPILYSPDDVMLASDCPLWTDVPETAHLLYTSQDQGKSWQTWEYPGGQLYALEGEKLLALGRDIYRSDNKGLTWTLTKQVAWDGQFSFVSALNGWAIARDDEEIAFVYTEDGGRTWQLIEPGLIP